jgi:hypothetical protein
VTERQLVRQRVPRLVCARMTVPEGDTTRTDKAYLDNRAGKVCLTCAITPEFGHVRFPSWATSWLQVLSQAADLGFRGS